jgi:hypothetical protein
MARSQAAENGKSCNPVSRPLFYHARATLSPDSVADTVVLAPF